MKAYFKRVFRAIMNRPVSPPTTVQAYSLAREYQVQVCETVRRFQNKTAVVTGAAGWIGQSICRRLGVEGATVYLIGRTQSSLDALSEQMREEGAVGIPRCADVTDIDSIKPVLDRIVQEAGAIDIFVNCAGGSAREKMTDLVSQQVEVLDDVIRTNLRGTLLCTKAAGEKMIAQGSGRIINVSSVIADHGKPGCVDYAAAKAGINGMTRSVAQELGPYGITVNCVSPGFIQRDSYTNKRLPYLLNSNFLRKIGTAEDIAAATAFLASDDAQFITGQNIVVDGGRSLGLHGD